MAATSNLPRTISLIGMPGAGKSTVGVILAKLTGLRFVDTDLDIQSREQARLQDILEQQGHLRLRAIEEEILLDIDLGNAVISTGGSVVYSEPAVERLRSVGPLIYLQADLTTLVQRVSAAPPRGIACAASQSYADVYTERVPLYEHWADITVKAAGTTADQVAADIIEKLANWPATHCRE